MTYLTDTEAGQTVPLPHNDETRAQCHSLYLIGDVPTWALVFFVVYLVAATVAMIAWGHRP